MTVPLWAWAGTLAVFAVLIAADLVFTKEADGNGLRAAAVLSGLWIAAGLAFGGVLWLWRSPAIAGQYFAGYLLEKALSVDNIFVFVLLFASLVVAAPLQRRVLYFGVVGALVPRDGFIAAGGALIDHISWVFYVFGALVLLAGARMFRPGTSSTRGETSRRRAWAEHSLERFGMQLIIVCRFIPGGRTAVTLSCGLISYPRRRFIIATAIAGIIWALYAFFIGRLGGKAFEDKPWAGFLVAFGITIVISGLIEAIRRIRSRWQRHRRAGQRRNTRPPRAT